MSKIFMFLLLMLEYISIVTSLTCGRNYTNSVETIVDCDWSIFNGTSHSTYICDKHNQTKGTIGNCIFLDVPSEMAVILCNKYSMGSYNDSFEFIQYFTPVIVTRVVFIVNGPAQETKNSSIWCLSILKVEIKKTDFSPPRVEWIWDMDDRFSKLLMIIIELGVDIMFPNGFSEIDAFVELPLSCNLNKRPIPDDCVMNLDEVIFLSSKRYDKYDNFTMISNEFLKRRQGVINEFRFYTRIEVDTRTLLVNLSKFNVERINMNGENIDMRKGLKSFFPNLTHLYLSACGIPEVYPDNFHNFVNVEVLDLSRNKLMKVPVGLELLRKLKSLDLSYQQWEAFDLNFGHQTIIEELFLRGLPITNLVNTNFSWVPNLKFLHLQSCMIVSIEENTFHGLKYLSLLNLSDNKKLNHIFGNTFLHLASLALVSIANNPQLNNSIGALNFKNVTILDLSNCSLKSFPGTISVIEIVTILDLSFNSITELKRENFIFKIKALNISGNKFETIDSETGDILSQLQSDIGGNPFDCQNCAQNQFRHFLDTSFDTVYNLGTNKTLKCVYPVGDEDKDIVSVNFVCYSYWITVGTPVASAFIFLSILTVALGYAYRFELIYIKQLWRMKRKNEESLTDRNVPIEFDAFVSYCAADRRWVMEKLLPSLEPPLGQYNLCLHERDFDVGKFIMDNIVENIEKSRRVIFVLSNKFLESEWCKWELRMATHRIFEKSKRDFLILLTLEDLKRELVPLSLRVLLATRTYLEWNQERPEIFWLRLRQTLGKAISCPVSESQDVLEPFRDVDEILNELKAVRNDPEMLENYINNLDP